MVNNTQQEYRIMLQIQSEVSIQLPLQSNQAKYKHFQIDITRKNCKTESKSSSKGFQVWGLGYKV